MPKSHDKPVFVIMCALPPEALAVRAGLRVRSGPGGHGGRVALVGMGPARARRAAARWASVLGDGVPVIVMGVGGALLEGLRPGELVVAKALGRAQVGLDGRLRVVHPPVEPDASSARLADSLGEALGDEFGAVRLAPMISATRTARGAERAALGESGAVICDTESFWLARLAARRPFAVVRAIVDTPERELVSLQTVTGGVAGLRRLGEAARVVAAVASGARQPSR